MKKLTSWLALISLWLCCTVVAHAGTHHYYYTDPQGTVLAKADASGTIIATYDYAPYGTAVASMSPAPNGPGYTGHVNDPDTGLVYMQARYYDPAVGRFLSVDPLNTDPNTGAKFNRYAYALNNPLKFIDPDGRDEEWFNNVDLMGNPGGGNQLGGLAITTSVGTVSVVGVVMVASESLPAVAVIAIKKIEMVAGSKLSPEAARGIRSLEKRIAEHTEKLKEFRKSPTVRPGMENMSKEAIEKQQQRRVQHLEKEIQTFKDNIEKLKNPPPPPPPPPVSAS